MGSSVSAGDLVLPRERSEHEKNKPLFISLDDLPPPDNLLDLIRIFIDTE